MADGTPPPGLAERLGAPSRIVTPRAARERDVRLNASLRLGFASGCVIVYCLDPSDDPARRPWVYLVLLLFLLYSAVVGWQALRNRRWFTVSWMPWVDLCWSTLLIGVSEGTSSIFYPLYMFAIVCSAFDGGFRTAIPIIVASVGSFSIVGGLTAAGGTRFELDRSLIRPLYLSLMGYLVAHWGEYQVQQRERLELLRDVTALSNPRFGIDQTVGRLIARLRSFFRAGTCRLVVTRSPEEPAWTRVSTAAAPDATAPIDLPPGSTRLVDVPATAALLYHGEPGWLRRGGAPRVECFDVLGTSRRRERSEVAMAVAAELDAASFLCVPFHYGSDAIGRMVVTSGRRGAFDASDADFLVQVLEQVVPVLENVRLVDRLASDAAEDERRRVGRDLHDSVIQPYIGVRMGLAAARHAVVSGAHDEAVRVLDRLSVIAEDEIQALRAYVHGLQDGQRVVGGELLADSVRRFSARFSVATGIRVQVESSGGVEINDRLAAEAFQMVTEALSNVRKHTDARSAVVRIAIDGSRLALQVENDGASIHGDRTFLPRSLRDRAQSLGGTLTVMPGPTTTVRVEIPL